MRRDARAGLESAGISFDGGAGEGMFLWGRLPDSTPVDELVRRAREKSILLAKGSLFSASQESSQWLRFNAAHSASAPLVRFLSDEIRAVA
jgi:DNA-binding transcriptional MocR family regulator